MKIGFAGLGKMGMPMASRLVKGGFEVAGFDVSADNLNAAAACGVTPCDSVAAMCAQLTEPRIVWIQTPPGKITNDLVANVGQYLHAGDVIVDGGNSDFRDSLRSAAALKEKGIHFVDCGVSGGVAGACGTGVFGSAGPGAACPAAGQWQNTVRSRACRICTLPVLAAALRTGFDERPELGRTGCLAGDLCRTGPLLRGRHWRSVRYSLLERGELTKMLALCWRNCRKAGNERN